MPVVRISEQLFERLQAVATPFVDTPATVIQRLLDFYDQHHESRPPERRPTASGRDSFREVVMERNAGSGRSTGGDKQAGVKTPPLNTFESRLLRRGRLGSIEQEAFADLVLSGVLSLGGSAPRHRVLDLIHTTWGHQFEPPDLALLESQTPPKERWIHNADWAKRKLVVEGFLLPVDKAPHGVWVLTPKGQRAAESLAS